MFSKGLATKLGWGDVSMHQVIPCLYTQFFASICIFFLALMYILVPTNILCMNKILFDEDFVSGAQWSGQRRLVEGTSDFFCF